MAAMIGVLGAAAAAQAQTTGLDLAKSKACMACHQVEAKRVGPPLKAWPSAMPARGDAMVDYLAGKIRGGGRGAWEPMPMPAQTQVSAEDARQLANGSCRWRPPSSSLYSSIRPVV